MSVIGSTLNLGKIGLFLALETPFRPRWAYYRARAYAYHYLLDRMHQARTHEYRSRVRPLHEAVAYVTGRSEDDVRAVDDSELIRSMTVGHGHRAGVENQWVVSLGDYGADAKTRTGGPIEIFYGPSPELMRLVNLVCRLVRPEHVIETGVAKGFTTSSMLDALDRNQSGSLQSVELPSLYLGYADQVGECIPTRLRDRWTLEFGPSAVVMPKIIKRIGSLDVFVHDSAANYDNQMTEFRIALGSMPAGGILISDMLNNDAFLETVEATNSRWAVIEQSKAFPVGLMCKLE